MEAPCARASTRSASSLSFIRRSVPGATIRRLAWDMTAHIAPPTGAVVTRPSGVLREHLDGLPSSEGIEVLISHPSGCRGLIAPAPSAIPTTATHGTEQELERLAGHQISHRHHLNRADGGAAALAGFRTHAFTASPTSAIQSLRSNPSVPRPSSRAAWRGRRSTS